MTQHEYVFVAVSIILGLAITRLLHTAAMLVRAHLSVTFHWATALWALSVMAFVLQFWWVGWGLRELEAWSFLDFLVLIIGSICVYGAAEMALPVPEAQKLDFLRHSKRLGRLSALFMLLYFCVGPYVNLSMLPESVPLMPALLVPGIGILITSTIIVRGRWFPGLSLAFALYALAVLILTA